MRPKHKAHLICVGWKPSRGCKFTLLFHLTWWRLAVKGKLCFFFAFHAWQEMPDECISWHKETPLQTIILRDQFICAYYMAIPSGKTLLQSRGQIEVMKFFCSRSLCSRQSVGDGAVQWETTYCSVPPPFNACQKKYKETGVFTFFSLSRLYSNFTFHHIGIWWWNQKEFLTSSYGKKPVTHKSLT